MPIYEYQCSQCGRHFEWLTRSGEEAVCPACGGSKLERQLSVPATPRSAGSDAACPARQVGACGMSGSGCGGCEMAR